MSASERVPAASSGYRWCYIQIARKETNLFEELIEIAENKLRETEDSPSHEDILDLAVATLIAQTKTHEIETVKEIVSSNDAFIERNRTRWHVGFQKLHALHQTALQAGMEFQKQFLKHDEYKEDVLFGVLMRQHAHACRISGEIIHLLECGYPDGAVARWRTLYEISVTCLLIQKYGRDMAADYVRYGMVKNSEGIIEHQKTAAAMGLESFTDEELEAAKALKDGITEGERSWHWARKHAGVSKLEKLREIVGLGKWSHNYKLASRNVHSDYYEMSTLYGMSEAVDDILLVGQSNSGLTSPAHFTAISLAQITCAFILADSEDEQCELDFTDSILFAKLIDNYIDEVGEAFLSVNGDGKDLN